MKRESGFTLVELLVAMVIGAIVMAAAYSSFISQQKAYGITEAVSDIQQNLRAAMLFIERDLRMAGFNPKKDTAFGFTSIPSDSFTFTKDVNENGTVDTGETITYDIASNTLRRYDDTGGDPQEIADNITGMQLKYFNRDGVETTILDSVRSVSVKLMAEEDNHTRELTTIIKCRNMGL